MILPHVSADIPHVSDMLSPRSNEAMNYGPMSFLAMDIAYYMVRLRTTYGAEADDSDGAPPPRRHLRSGKTAGYSILIQSVTLCTFTHPPFRPSRYCISRAHV